MVTEKRKESQMTDGREGSNTDRQRGTKQGFRQASRKAGRDENSKIKTYI